MSPSGPQSEADPTELTMFRRLPNVNCDSLLYTIGGETRLLRVGGELQSRSDDELKHLIAKKHKEIAELIGRMRAHYD